MNKKTYAVVAVIIIVLYLAIVLSQTSVLGLGEVFGYAFYGVLIAGIIAAIWLLVKRPQKVS